MPSYRTHYPQMQQMQKMHQDMQMQQVQMENRSNWETLILYDFYTFPGDFSICLHPSENIHDIMIATTTYFNELDKVPLTSIL